MFWYVLQLTLWQISLLFEKENNNKITAEEVMDSRAP